MFILIEAGPGCGKTETLAGISLVLANPAVKFQYTPTDQQRAIFDFCIENLPQTQSVLACAYNTSAKEHLETKVPSHVECKTSHGLGYTFLNDALGRQRLVGNRMQTLVEKITGTPLKNLQSKEKNLWYAAIAHTKCLKGELLPATEESLTLVRNRYSNLAGNKQPIDYDLIQACNQLLLHCRKIAGQIDFDDQLYLPFCTDAIYKKYEVALVDECQDLSTSRFQLALGCAKHIIFCGDPNQAINAFSGALPDIFDKIRDTANFVFPLKTCFRCPPNAIEAANNIRPSQFPIQPLPGKSRGPERRIRWSDVIDEYSTAAPSTTLTLSRTNANNVRLCIALTRAGIPAYINSSSSSPVVPPLMGLAKFVARKPTEFIARVRTYLDGLSEKKPPHQLQYLQDQADCITEVIRDSSPTTWSALEDALKALFKKPSGHAHMLSTVHRAKGLEATNVYVLFPPIPHPLGMKDPVQAEQEKNLEYVAKTRTSFSYTEIYP